MTKSEMDGPRPLDETIVAVSTPPGHGALGIIRISGPRTTAFLEAHCLNQKKNPIQWEKHLRLATLAGVYSDAGQKIDEGIVIYYPEGHSFTGEASAELTLHGNPLILRKVLDQAIRIPGIRPAEPGEFSGRAFRSGKLDLAQAEAIRMMIEARSDFELEAGRKLHSGELSRTIDHFRNSMVRLRAETAAEVDFPEEDLTFESREARRKVILNMIHEMEGILKNSDAALQISSGYQVALAGIPNAGKSSLLNRILGWDRSIVSPTAGTTRDYIAETFLISGVEVRFVDTAGLRETEDALEGEGVRRSREEIDRSNIILNVLDGSLPVYELSDFSPEKRVFRILNKADALDPGWKEFLEKSRDRSESELIAISSLTGEGIETLMKAIEDHVQSGRDGVHPLLLLERHRYHFQRIILALENVLNLWETGAPDEIVALELDEAIEHTGRISGKITNEEVLGEIFSTFCVGK